MMNKRGLIILYCVISMVFLLISFSCSSGQPGIINVDDEGNTVIDTEKLAEAINENPAASLTGSEEEGILFMREEEKLARDVYRTLYDTWGNNTFSNISNSEETHMDAVKSLIDKYGLDDPAEGMDIGEFINAQLQKLYDDLVSQGSKSEIDALKAGAAIEEIDIIDLEKYVQQTAKDDIKIVYESLLKGSRNHLRSFISVMSRRGVAYEPQYLNSDQYNEIITSDIEKGSN